MGRPSIYTQELAERICKRIAKGESVLRICKDDDMPNASMIYDWLFDADKKWFSDNYAKARASQAEHLFDELLEIADDGTNDYMKEKGELNHEHINRSRLRVDTRKWYLSKVLPKKFGEKIDVTTGGEKLPNPIYGGISKHDIDKENIQSKKED